jgi:N-acetylgalactosamine-6-phosphate deacetylase
MVEHAGNAEDAIHMASLHPARLLGIDNQLGSLAPGKRANIIALDGGLHLQQIWIQGQALPFSPFIVSPVGLTTRS